VKNRHIAKWDKADTTQSCRHPKNYIDI
jgi:hypothetical protein